MVDKNNIEEAKVVGQTIQIPRSKATKDLVSKINSLSDKEFSYKMLLKGKYTIRGSMIGLAVGVGVAMYFKRSLFGGAILGATAGTFAGYGVSKIMEKIEAKKQNKK